MGEMTQDELEEAVNEISRAVIQLQARDRRSRDAVDDLSRRVADVEDGLPAAAVAENVREVVDEVSKQVVRRLNELRQEMNRELDALRDRVAELSLEAFDREVAEACGQDSLHDDLLLAAGYLELAWKKFENDGVQESVRLLAARLLSAARAARGG